MLGTKTRRRYGDVQTLLKVLAQMWAGRLLPDDRHSSSENYCSSSTASTPTTTSTASSATTAYTNATSTTTNATSNTTAISMTTTTTTISSTTTATATTHHLNHSLCVFIMGSTRSIYQ